MEGNFSGMMSNNPYMRMFEEMKRRREMQDQQQETFTQDMQEHGQNQMQTQGQGEISAGESVVGPASEYSVSGGEGAAMTGGGGEGAAAAGGAMSGGGMSGAMSGGGGGGMNYGQMAEAAGQMMGDKKTTTPKAQLQSIPSSAVSIPQLVPLQSQSQGGIMGGQSRIPEIDQPWLMG